MGRFLGLALLLVIVPLSAFASDGDLKLSDLPHAQRGDLLLAAYAVREIPLPILDSAHQPNGPALTVYFIHAYLVNRGSKPITFLLGTEEQVGKATSGSMLAVMFGPSYWNGFSDVSIKPRIEDYRPITLMPGEVASLPMKRLEASDPPKRLKIGYGVPADFEKVSDVWTGSVTVDVPVP